MTCEIGQTPKMELDRLPPITLASPACPYCGAIQDPPPQRRKKCKDCGEVIHTWTDREARKKYLLTEQEAKAQERSRRDARWKELSEQVRVASQAGDFQALRLAYDEQSHILFAEGRNHLHVQKLSSQVQLLHLQSIGVEKVRISTSQDERVCSHCKSWEGKVITVEDALEQMPIPRSELRRQQIRESPWRSMPMRPHVNIGVFSSTLPA